MVALFRWLIDQVMLFARFVYPLLRSQPLWLIPYLIATVIIWGLLSLVIGKDQTDLLGSGVPQIEAILKDQYRMKWWPVLWKKFVGGLLSICPGLFLGREGPCIQMGAAIGQGMGERPFSRRPGRKQASLIVRGRRRVDSRLFRPLSQDDVFTGRDRLPLPDSRVVDRPSCRHQCRLDDRARLRHPPLLMATS